MPATSRSAHDAQHPVAGVADAGRREAHLRVLGDVEEVGRAQVLVAGRVPGVEAVGVDRQLDRRAVWRRARTSRRTGRSGRERSIRPQNVLTVKLDGRSRRGRRSSASAQPLSASSLWWSSHLLSLICDERSRRAMPSQCQAVGPRCRGGHLGAGLLPDKPLGAEQEDRERSFARGEHGGCQRAPSGAPPRSESPRDDLHEGRCDRQPRAGLARPCSGPREREEDRRERGSFDERPFPTRDETARHEA